MVDVTADSVGQRSMLDLTMTLTLGSSAVSPVDWMQVYLVLCMHSFSIQSTFAIWLETSLLKMVTCDALLTKSIIIIIMSNLLTVWPVNAFQLSLQDHGNAFLLTLVGFASVVPVLHCGPSQLGSALQVREFQSTNQCQTFIEKWNLYEVHEGEIFKDPWGMGSRGTN